MEDPSSANEENLEENEQNTEVEEEPQDPTTETSETLLTDVQEEPKDPTIETSELLPQDVLCDSCMDGPSRALKSCLTCMVSYCQAHLRPHLENAKFQNHRLVDPLHDIDVRTCEVHHLPVERFCVTDSCCLCVDCEAEEHQGHQAAAVGEARTQIEAELQKKQVQISQSSAAAEKSIEKLESNNDLIKSSVLEVCALVSEQFNKLQMSVDEARRGTVEVLEGEKRKALRQAAGIQAHLEQRREGLMKTVARMNKVAKCKCDVDFLQEYSQLKKGLSDTSLPTTGINRMDHLSSYVRVITETTQEMCDLIVSSYRQKLTSVWENSAKSLMQESPASSLPHPETREDFLQYTRSLTFDPDTTHNFLQVKEGSKKLINTSPWQHSYPDNPDRFEYWRQAMTVESLYLERHYIEAELSGEGAHVGVTYKSIDRKGEQSTSCITGNDFSWCVGRNSRGFFAWHDGVESQLEVTAVSRVGIYVDFHSCSVSFYDVSESMKLLHEFTASFIEPLYVVTWLSKKDNVVCLVDAQ